MYLEMKLKVKYCATVNHLQSVHIPTAVYLLLCTACVYHKMDAIACTCICACSSCPTFNMQFCPVCATE